MTHHDAPQRPGIRSVRQHVIKVSTREAIERALVQDEPIHWQPHNRGRIACDIVERSEPGTRLVVSGPKPINITCPDCQADPEYRS